MKKKFRCKIAVDALMTVLLLFLMARQITGDAAHEWLGAGMFVLWIVHHILNRSWYSHLFKGAYMPVRVLQTGIDVAVLLSMLGLMVSGIILSREVFAFLPLSRGIALARALHIVSAFWGFVLMALHLGMHWNMVLGVARKAIGSAGSGTTRIVSRIGGVLIAGYGAFAFFKNQIFSYLFYRTHFVFFDYEKPVPLFFAEYLAMMGLFVFLAHYASRGVWKLSGRKKAAAKTV